MGRAAAALRVAGAVRRDRGDDPRPKAVAPAAADVGDGPPAVRTVVVRPYDGGLVDPTTAPVPVASPAARALLPSLAVRPIGEALRVGPSAQGLGPSPVVEVRAGSLPAAGSLAKAAEARLRVAVLASDPRPALVGGPRYALPSAAGLLRRVGLVGAAAGQLLVARDGLRRAAWLGSAGRVGPATTVAVPRRLIRAVVAGHGLDRVARRGGPPAVVLQQRTAARPVAVARPCVRSIYSIFFIARRSKNAGL